MALTSSRAETDGITSITTPGDNLLRIIIAISILATKNDKHFTNLFPGIISVC